MKKHYLLFALIVWACAQTSAQNYGPVGFPQAQLKTPDKQQVQPVNKVPGTVLYYEDFDSSGNASNNFLPPGWSTGSFVNANHVWIWSDAAPGGQYSTTIPPIASVTTANGFLLLPSDLYNTPFPPNGPVDMEAFVTSSAISITPTGNVILQFQQYYRYCCLSNSELVVEVSSDGITWTTYDITLGRSNSAVTPNPELMEFNVSSTLAFQNTAYFRFRQSSASHYFFMVDDLKLIEGVSNAIEVTDVFVHMNDTFAIKPIYTQMVSAQALELGFSAKTLGLGSASQTGVKTHFKFYHDSTLNGIPGFGLVFTDTVAAPSAVSFNQVDSFRTNSNFGSLPKGKMRLRAEVTSNAVNQLPAGAVKERTFIISDTVIARDNGFFTTFTGPDRYVGGGNNGDKMGVLMDFGEYSPSPGQFNVSSVSVYIANDTHNLGIGISPRIWHFDGTQSTLAAAFSSSPIGSSPFLTIITPAMLGNWVNLPVFPTSVLATRNQYVIGIEQMTTSNPSHNIRLGRDGSMEGIAPAVSNFVYINDASPTWGWITQVPGIRLIKDFFSSVAEETTKNNFSILPNPSNGQFKLNLQTAQSGTYELNIRNSLGQLVYTERLNVNGELNKSIHLDKVKSGLYFVSLSNGKKRMVEKLIID